MEGFVITGVLEPFNLTWRVDGVASTIIGILIHDENNFAMVDTPTGDPTPPDSPAEPDLHNTKPCEAFTFDDSTLEHIMDT